jgi:hypothetical protein
MHGVPATMWWTLKTVPSARFPDAYRWVMAELGQTYKQDNVTDEQLENTYRNLKGRKDVLRPLLIARNQQKGLAVPEVSVARIVCRNQRSSVEIGHVQALVCHVRTRHDKCFKHTMIILPASARVVGEPLRSRHTASAVRLRAPAEWATQTTTQISQALIPMTCGSQRVPPVEWIPNLERLEDPHFTAEELQTLAYHDQTFGRKDTSGRSGFITSLIGARGDFSRFASRRETIRRALLKRYVSEQVLRAASTSNSTAVPHGARLQQSDGDVQRSAGVLARTIYMVGQSSAQEPS